jgi:iron complex outermembrane receptor protein
MVRRPRSGSWIQVIVLVLRLVALPRVAHADDDDEVATNQIVVTATRDPGLIRDQPLRVEAVPAEEIEENMTVQPGNLSSLLNELPGARMQSQTPGLGGEGLQLRGLPPRETLVMTDGLPLLGFTTDGFGLLQVPPLDLAHVELIKGAVSALYGGGSLGGLLNLVSKPPTADSAILGNISSHGARDLEAFLAKNGAPGLGGTLTVGVYDQPREDLNGDGWSDIAGYRRYVVRARAWGHEDPEHSLFLTAGITQEDREGGTQPGRVLPTGATFAEALHTQRLDGGIVGHGLIDEAITLDGRFSVTSTNLVRVFGVQDVASTQVTIFGDESLSGTALGQRWVLGFAFNHDGLAVPAVPGVGHEYNVPGVYVQDTYAPTEWIELAGSARLDVHNTYGTFLSPRLSAVFRQPNSAWSLRASAGGGYAAPTPFVDEVEATGLGSLLPLHGLHAERAITESIDAKWAAGGWDLNASVFDSAIRNALEVQGAPNEKLELGNAGGLRRAPGVEALVHYGAGALQLIASWSCIHATDDSPAGLREAAPLVPRESAELGAILQQEKRGRIGMEVGYTGRQALQDDPYRTFSEPYIELNALGELHLGAISIFINAINLTNVRQTRFEPLLRTSPGLGGTPITPVWAPLDGRTFNIGIRADL